jgi:predicted ATPase
VTHDGANYFIITGGPGAGKSTLLAAAARYGYSIVPESGRAILQAQAAIGGRAVHWGDRSLYAELMLDREMRNHQDFCKVDGAVLFDRGVPDLLGYARLCGLGDVDHFRRAAEVFRYNVTVFVAPPWREIYASDSERTQDWAEAVRTYEMIIEGYAEAGYDLIELPCLPVAKRLGFVQETIGAT